MGKARNLANVPNAPIFSAHRATTNQSLTSGVVTKIQCQTEEVDSASAYDNATNYRFQPQVAGWYQINATLYVQGATMTTIGVYLHKNGSSAKAGNVIGLGGGTQASAVANALIYLNGSSDYVEMHGLAYGMTLEVLAGANLTYFQGHLVKAA